ncbi:class I SAM-dependent methyltransferase [Desulfopila sp. IMCC35006]|nr:methyltransferase domain-containing protein [Desulfopila sp. IMCC35006]TKB26549.1 class I SAM-dependent methyltransferase [Desulfopila sp. IMCC35006]
MKTETDIATCPLCNCRETVLFFQDKKRRYRQCQQCRLVFVPSRYWLPADQEKAVYDLHENDPGDQGYRHFLSRLSSQLLAKLKAEPGQRGLDFGCGPGPTLSKMMEEHGHQMDLYDPFFADDPAVFTRRYDFITATEVVEHLRDPYRQWTRLFVLLKKGGWLGIMTKLVTDKQAFASWHYIRDLTHICFYSQPTFSYLAACFDAELSFAADDVILFQKRQE